MAVITTLMMIVIFGMFYSLEVLAYPAAIGMSLVVVFVLGILLRHRRGRLHGRAVAHEFGNHDNSPPSAE